MANTPTLHTTVPTLDTLLENWRTVLGKDYIAYRNHCYRVFNLSCALTDTDDIQREQLAIAIAFHDAGIWLNNTFDYLEPSIAHASDYLAKQGRADWDELVAQIIREHHQFRPLRGASARPAEALRRADWFDVFLFMLPTRVARSYLRMLLKTFPRRGFHLRLATLTVTWWLRHPLRPLPMMRW